MASLQLKLIFSFLSLFFTFYICAHSSMAASKGSCFRSVEKPEIPPQDQIIKKPALTHTEITGEPSSAIPVQTAPERIQTRNAQEEDYLFYKNKNEDIIRRKHANKSALSERDNAFLEFKKLNGNLQGMSYFRFLSGALGEVLYSPDDLVTIVVISKSMETGITDALNAITKATDPSNKLSGELYDLLGFEKEQKLLEAAERALAVPLTIFEKHEAKLIQMKKAGIQRPVTLMRGMLFWSFVLEKLLFETSPISLETNPN